MALQSFTAQLELIYMLIQVSRDVETREVVFKHNVDFIAGSMVVKGFEKINSEALYVCVAQMQHNWGIAGKDPVGSAIKTFDSTDKALLARGPSPDLDIAIAKGVARFLMRVLQEQRFQNAVSFLKKRKYPRRLTVDSKLKDLPAATEWELTRFLDKYWSTLQSGANTQDKSKVVVPGFLVPATSPPSGNYVWVEKGTTFDFGPVANMDMRFEHDDFTIRSLSGTDKVNVRDERTGNESEQDVKAR